ncbi:MAG: permease [Crocinitomicaceae bacterium]|nr:permease [Crocinitomicaceae bacterium]|tara:strand:- start:3412 stop:3813 length:402 start_codon:yes stop_codon:yes gene_type:complete
MDSQTLIILIFIGLTAGIASGFIGIGGGIVIIPALIYFLGLTQFEAQGVSLTLMLPPIGVLAFYNYYQQGHLSKQLIIFALIMGAAFILGGFIGSKISLKTPVHWVKIIFGSVMLYVSIKMIMSGLKILMAND